MSSFYYYDCCYDYYYNCYYNCYYDDSDYNYSAHDRSGPGDRLGKAPDRPAAPSSMVPLAAKKFGESPVRRSVPRVAAILLLAACWAGAAHANQGLIVRDDSMGVGQGLAVGPGIDPDFSPNNGQVDYLIPSEMGTTRGENLFHSFSRFGIGLGEVASFIGDAGAIARIIARVTGSEGSQVDGVMRSSVAGADVFLLNPNGVIFGPSGAIDVQGSFAVSTADRLEFSDGLFDVADVAAPWGGSACCGGAPTAYLFAGADAATAGDPAEIKIEIRTGFGGYVDVPVGEQVSAVGGMITVGEGRVILTGGAILFAATGHATVRVPVDLALDGTWNVALGDEAAIRLGPGSKLYTSNPVDLPSGNGRVVLRGGRLELDTAEVSAGGPDGGGVDLWFSGDVDLTGLQVGSLIFPALIIDRSSGPQADGIRLVAGTLSLNDFSQIATTAGALGLEAETVSLGHLSRIASTTGGITLSAGTLSLDDFALIEATAGKIDITSQGATRVENGAVIRTITAFENSGAPVDAGDLDLKAGSLELISGGQINSLTGSGSAPGSDPRAAGNIDITVTDGLRIEGRIGITDPDTGDVSFARSGILARALEGATAEASGGNITVTAGSVEMANGASVSASSKTGASAGSITITAGSSIRLTGGVVAAGEELAEISSRGHGGPAGNVHVEAASIEVLDGAAISASSQEAGRAGDVTVIANHLRVSGRSTQGAGGPVSQASAIYAEAPTDSTVPGGSAGKLDVRLQDGLEISEGGELSVRTRGSGSAGAVVVRVEQGSIDISSGGRVLSQSTATHAGAGAAGSLSLYAAGDIRIRDGAALEATAEVVDAGDIRLEAGGKLTLIDGLVNTRSGSALGGNIWLDAGSLVELVRSGVETDVGGAGNGGNIRLGQGSENVLGPPRFAVLNASRLTATAEKEQGGFIFIAAGQYVESADSQVDASSGDPEKDGIVELDAPELEVSGNLEVLPSSYLDVSVVLQEHCAARRDHEGSSLTLEGRPNIGPEPGGYLVASVMAPASVASQAAAKTARAPKASLLPLTAQLAAFDPKCGG